MFMLLALSSLLRALLLSDHSPLCAPSPPHSVPLSSVTTHLSTPPLLIAHDSSGFGSVSCCNTVLSCCSTVLSCCSIVLSCCSTIFSCCSTVLSGCTTELSCWSTATNCCSMAPSCRSMAPSGCSTAHSCFSTAPSCCSTSLSCGCRPCFLPNIVVNTNQYLS